MALSFRSLWGRLRGLVTFARHPPVWLRKEHVEEEQIALRCGLLTRAEPILATPYSYLVVLVPDETLIGAIKLSGPKTSYAVLHRDTKGRGGWQTSYFCELLHNREEHHQTLQEALDAARDGGFVLQNVMTTAGEQRG